MITSKKLLTAALILTAAITVIAAPGERGRPPAGEHGAMQFRPPMEQGRAPLMEMMIRRLDLTPDQQQKLESIKENSAKSLRGNMSAQKELYQKLEKAVKQDDTTLAAGVAAEIADGIVRQTKTRIRIESAVKDILTPEQNARLQEMKQNFRQRAAGPQMDRPGRMYEGRRDLRESFRPGAGDNAPEQKRLDSRNSQPLPGRAMRPQAGREDIRRFNRDGSCTEKDSRPKQMPRAQVQPQTGSKAQNAERLNYMFDKADADGDGLISKEELRKFFGARKAQIKEQRQ
jgi:Spy/CpxP family protein refolding chaperone